MSNLESAKRELKLINYILSEKKKITNNTYRINPCPVCGGKDHFTIYTETNSYSSFNDCCKGGSILDYMIEVEGIEKAFAVKKILDLTGYSQRRENDMSTKIKKPITPSTVQSKKVIDLTQSVINHYNDNNTNTSYFKSRGLTSKIIEKYKLMVCNPKLILENNNNLLPMKHIVSNYEYILPIWENEKVVSMVLRRNDEKLQSEQKTLNLKGEQKIFNIDLLQSDNELIFITEGIFDGLAIESISDKYRSICLNSVSMVNKLIDSIKNNLENCKDKKFVLCGDSDQAGQEKLNKKMQQLLDELDIDNSVLDLYGYNDVNEFAVKDSNKFSYILHDITTNLETKGTTFSYIDNIFLEDINKIKSYQTKSTGFVDLNQKLNGGLHSGLYVLGATSSLGKTTFVHQISDNIASNGSKVLFFSLEQSQMELVSKSLSRELFKIDKHNSLTVREIMMGKVNNNLKLALSNYVPASKNIYIHEGNFNTTIKTIREKIEKHVKRFNDNPLVVVDYLQILQSIDVRMSDKQKVETNVTELKRISRDFNIPLIVISSLNRDSYLCPISFESFKETGGIEYTADVVLGLQYANIDSISQEKSKIVQRDLLKRESIECPRSIELVCLKQRNGQQTFSSGFEFIPHYNTFLEL